MATNAKKATDYSMTDGVIWKKLLFFFFPILLSTLFQQLYNTVDAMVVGRYCGKEALAAVGGATGALISLIVGFFVGLASGATVIISQFYGAHNDDGVGRTVHTAMAMALTGGALLMAVGYFLTPAMLRMMDTPADVMEHAAAYMRIYFLGMIPSLIYNVGASILRAIGDSKRPLYFLIAACLMNIALDLLMVIGLNMGVAGAALATILSQLISAVLVIVVLSRSQESYRLRVRQIRFHGDLLAQIIRIGLPAGLQSVLYSVSNIIIQKSVNSFGTDVMAAWTAWGKLDAVLWTIINSFGITITTFVGQNFGAGKYDRMRKSVRICFLMCAGGTLVLSTGLMLSGDTLFRLFNNEESVLAQCRVILQYLGPCFVLYVPIEIYSGAVRGAGDSLIPTLMTLGGICVLRAIWVLLIAPAHNSVIFMLLSYPITWVITSALFVIYYYRGNWLRRCRLRAGLNSPEVREEL